MKRTVVPAVVVAVVALAVFGAAESAAQNLPLKRPALTAEHPACPPLVEEARQPDPDAAQEATRLVREGNRAGVAGHHESAREHLARATELDPTDARAAYLLGRTYEELDRPVAALQAYCRTLALALGGESDEALASEAEGTLDRLADADDVGEGMAEGFAEDFREGVAAFDDGDLERAHRAFHRVVEQAPEWPPGLYNRGVTALERGRAEAARQDLTAYLERMPDARDREVVEVAVGFLAEGGGAGAEPPGSGPDATTTFLAGLVPGGGQIYTGRAVEGIAVAGAAAGLVIFGVTHERIHVECRSPIGAEGECPDGEVIRRTAERPYQELAVGGAVAVTLLGALEAVWRVRRDRSDEEAGPLADAARGILGDRVARRLTPRLTSRVQPRAGSIPALAPTLSVELDVGGR